MFHDVLQPALIADTNWLGASVPWLLAALVIAATVAAIGVWTLVARVRELEQLARRFDALGSIENLLGKLVADRGDLDLRRVEHVLLELRDAARRLEDSLLRATQANRSGTSSSSHGSSAASLSDRVIDRLLAQGYEHVQLVTTLEELEKIFEADGALGEVLVEARHNGVLCKGRVLVRNGAVTEVELKPAYSMFPLTNPFSMSVTTIERLSAHVGQAVTLQGWVYARTSKGKLHFVQLRDGTGIAQCVLFKNNVGDELFEAVAKAGQESSIVLTGTVKADPRAPGGFEIDVSSGRVVQAAAEGYPITPKEHGIDFLLENRHLWLRSKKPWAVLRVRHAIITAIRNFFDERGFICVDSPIFTPNACEGTSTLFEVPYFDSKAYLTQSGQLYAEAAAMALGKVYCFGPTFRAEKSKTRRHLTEFWMLEPEVAFATLEDIMQLAEDMLCYVVAYVLKTRKPELAALERDLSKLEAIVPPFPRMTYDEAAAVLAKHPESTFKHGDDFGAPDETIISSAFDRPVMVHRYPSAIKAFYMKRDPNDETKCLSCDVLGSEGVGEIIGGSQREDDLELLLARIRHEQLPEQFFQWYLDLRRYGSVPHAGFGLGLERTVAWICGIEHVREAIPFPRTIYRIHP